MRKLSARGIVRAIAGIIAITAILLGILSIPWRPSRPAEPPRVVKLARGAGPLTAGAAEVALAPPSRAPIAGFPRLRYTSVGVRDPLYARAVVLQAPGCKVALVSAELLLVNGALADAVRQRVADLRLDGLVVAATHSHAAVGGYWDHAVAERIAMGGFDPAILAGLADRIALAVRLAAGDLRPARVASGSAEHDELARNRAGTGEVDGHLAVARLESLEGDPVAELVLFPAHPTLLKKRNRLLSGDWPGKLMTARDRRGVRLFFQGAGGDQSARLPWGGKVVPEEYGAAVSHAAGRVALAAPEARPVLAWAEARTVLPEVSMGAVPALLRPAVRNVLGGMMPAEAKVGALALGPLTLLVVPAEPVAAVGARWRERAGPGAEVLSVASDYLGYVELADRMSLGAGETKRTYFGPELEGRLGAAVAAATDALREGRAADAAAARVQPGSRPALGRAW